MSSKYKVGEEAIALNPVTNRQNWTVTIEYASKKIMETENEKQDKLLFNLGLKRHMEWKSGHLIVYNESEFTSYVSSEYKKSKRKVVDTVYGIFEIVLFHNKTGLRIGYTTTEDYYGDIVKYKLNKIFIITETDDHHDVLIIDFKKQVFLTTQKIISFDKVSRLLI